MKKIILSVILVVAFVLPCVGHAGSLDNGKNDRKGFFLGFGVGGGMANLRASGTSETKAAFISDLKIGGGITEDILLMYDGFFGWTRVNGVDVEVLTFPVAVQWYPWKDWYIRPGVGISYVEMSTTVAGFNISASTDASFSGHLATGYDFRFGKSFALSPEVVYLYNHIRTSVSNGHLHAFGGQLSLMWFF